MKNSRFLSFSYFSYFFLVFKHFFLFFLSQASTDDWVSLCIFQSVFIFSIQLRFPDVEWCNPYPRSGHPSITILARASCTVAPLPHLLDSMWPPNHVERQVDTRFHPINRGVTNSRILFFRNVKNPRQFAFDTWGTLQLCLKPGAVLLVFGTFVDLTLWLWCGGHDPYSNSVSQ